MPCTSALKTRSEVEMEEFGVVIATHNGAQPVLSIRWRMCSAMVQRDRAVGKRWSEDAGTIGIAGHAIGTVLVTECDPDGAS